MAWQLRDATFREAIHTLVDRMAGRCALAGTVGVQIHLAATLGLDRRGPPAHAIEVVALGEEETLERVGDVPVALVDPLGLLASVEVARTIVTVGGERFPVASPEHILGMRLATPELPPDAKWACFVLMRACDGNLDLEQARGFLKRCHAPERQTLLAELAYLAA